MFSILGPLLSLPFVFVLPPLQVPDEVNHFFRAYSVAGGNCVAPTYDTVPAALEELHKEFPPRAESTRAPIRFGEYVQDLRAGAVSAQQRPTMNPTVNAYDCVPYLFSGLGVSIARLFSLPAIVWLYAATLANLIVYLGCVYTALQLLPVARLPLFVLALTPMTVHQAASVSADAVGFGIAFLFFAYTVHLALEPASRPLLRKQLLVLAGLLVFATLGKFNAWFALLPVLIPARRYGTAWRKAAWCVLFSAAVALVILGWQHWNAANIQHLESSRAVRQIDMRANLDVVVNNPEAFGVVLGRTLGDESLRYARQFVGTLGWASIPLPYPIVWVYLAALLASVSAESGICVAPRQRIVCGVIFAGCFLSLFVTLWTLEMTSVDVYQSAVRYYTGTIPGVQGRYFIPFVPVLFLAIANTWLRARAVVVAAVCAAVIVVTNAVALSLVYTAFYR